MVRLLGIVISIGLADSMNPSTIGPALFLAAGERPRRSVLGFTAAVFAVNLLGGALLTLGPGRAILAVVPHPGPTARYIVETIAGVAMLVAALVLWRRRGRLGQTGSGESEPSKFRSPVVMGATIAGVELPSAFPYFAAIAAVVGSGLGLVHQVILVIVYNACFVLPLLVIVLTLAIAGDGAVQLLQRIREFLQRNWPEVAAGVALVAGLFVVTLGVTGLTGRVPGRVGRFSRRLRKTISR